MSMNFLPCNQRLWPYRVMSFYSSLCFQLCRREDGLLPTQKVSWRRRDPTWSCRTFTSEPCTDTTTRRSWKKRERRGKRAVLKISRRHENDVTLKIESHSLSKYVFKLKKPSDLLTRGFLVFELYSCPGLPRLWKHFPQRPQNIVLINWSNWKEKNSLENLWVDSITLR